MKRGLDLDRVESFRLGFVENPIPGHEQYRGMLAIPYLRRSASGNWTVISMRFRRIGDNGPKYLSMPGDPPRLYNTADAVKEETEIHLTEGEFCAIAGSINGLPSVGVPGAEVPWKPHFTGIFQGYEKVWILADGDSPGIKFANNVASHLNNAIIVPMLPGEDVDSMILKHGIESIHERKQQ